MKLQKPELYGFEGVYIKTHGLSATVRMTVTVE
jgi:hypothetical protein